MRYLLFLPGIIFALLAILPAVHRANKAERARREQEAERAAAAEQRRQAAERKQAIQAAKAAEREAARAAREAEQQRKQAARLEAARQRAEYAERELAAKREMKAMERAQIIPDTEPDTEPDNEPTEPDTKPTATDARPKFKGNNAFAGQVVAFTGRLPGMTRREAIQAVQDNGGRAYTKMPAGTTLLVVGDKPGMCKMDKADEWIGQVRKITAAQFFAMLEQPLTLELDEFAAMFAA